MLTTESEFWKRELEDAAMLVLARVAEQRETITNEVPISSGRVASFASSSDIPLARLAEQAPKKKGLPQPASKKRRAHDRAHDEDGESRFRANRRGAPFARDVRLDLALARTAPMAKHTSVASACRRHTCAQS